MKKEYLTILTNIIGGVESGGQTYGKRKYGAYAGKAANADNEKTCTLGWAQNYGNEGRRLCQMILKADPKAFRTADTAGIEKKLSVDWEATRWNPTAKEKAALIMPIEISCYYLIERAKQMGVWEENDAHVPKLGEAVLYDWQDNGVGDNTGTPDHVGTVTYVNQAAGYFVVTEGNYSDSVKKRTVSLNGRYIRGFITPKYDSDQAESKPVNTPGKSVSTVAHEVIAGQWGNGEARRKALSASGYDPDAIQKEVNRILNGSAATTTKPQPADQTISKTVKSTCYAREYDKKLAGYYVTTADLYCRNDAGKNKKALCCIPKGTTVHNYGYYNTSNGTKWLYITVTLDGVEYIGFSSISYLKAK